MTVRACVASLADACIVVNTVDTRSTVHATTVRTVFVVGLTINAREAKLTLARVGINIFLTNGTVLTGLRQAFVDVNFTVFATKTVNAEARVITDAV